MTIRLGTWANVFKNPTIMLVLGYVAVGAATQRLAAPPSLISPVWPAAGLALAASLLRKNRALPGIWLASALVNLWFFLAKSTPMMAAIAAVSAGCGAVAEAWLCAHLLDRFLGRLDPFIKFRSTMVFVFCVATGCLASPVLGATVLVLASNGPIRDGLSSYLIWWGGDIIGILYVTPIATILLQQRRDTAAPGEGVVGIVRSLWRLVRPVLTLDPAKRMRASQREIYLFFAAIATTILVVFTARVGPRLSPVIFLLLLWSCFRLGFAYSQLAGSLVAVSAAVATAWGYGPFVHADEASTYMELQVFLLVSAYTILTISVSARRRIEKSTSLFENALVGIMITEPDGKIARVNPILASMLGYESPDEMIKQVSNVGGSSFFVHKGVRRELLEKIRATRDGILRLDKLSLLRKGGNSRVWVSYCAREVRDRTDQAVEFISFFTNIDRQMTFFDEAPLGICFSEVDGDKFLEVNSTLANMFGYESPDRMRADVTTISGDFYREPYERAGLKADLRKKRQSHRQYRAKKHGGQETICVEEDARLVHDSEGGDQILCFIRDVTELERNGRMTQLATKINHALVGDSDIPLMLTNCARAIHEYFRPESTEIWLPADSGSAELAAAWPVPTPPPPPPSLCSPPEGLRSEEMITQIGHDAGSVFLNMGEAGQVIGLVRIVQPSNRHPVELTYAVDLVNPIAVVVRKWLAKQALERSEQKFKTIAEMVPNGIFQSDSRGFPSFVNDELCRLQGVTRAEALSSEWSKNIHPPEAREKADGDWFDHVRKSPLKKWDTEYQFKVGGTLRTIRTIARPLLEGEVLTGFVGTTTDETTRVNEGLAIQDALEEIRHDMRYSLTTIGRRCKILAVRLANDPGSREFISRISDDKDHLETVVLKALKAAGRGLKEPQHETGDFALREEIDAWLRISLVEDRQDYRLNVQIDEELPRRVHGPTSMLRDVLHNLFHNAIKHAREKITVRVRRVASNDPERVAVEFEVEDDGPGITKERALQILPKNLDSNIGADTSRRGLGLRITRRKLRDFDSELGLIEGKDGNPSPGFRFRLLLSPGDDEPGVSPGSRLGDAADRQPSEPGRGVGKFIPNGPILLVEDRTDEQARLASNLLKWGMCPLTIVARGVEAVEAARITNFALILMDIHLGRDGGNGYDACREIRALSTGWPSETQPVILSISVTDLDPDAEARCKAAEMSGLIGKEFEAGDLVEFWSRCRSDARVFRGPLQGRQVLPTPSIRNREGDEARYEHPVDLTAFQHEFGPARDTTALALAKAIGKWLFALRCAYNARHNDSIELILHAMTKEKETQYCGPLRQAVERCEQGPTTGEWAIDEASLLELEQLGRASVQYVFSNINKI